MTSTGTELSYRFCSYTAGVSTTLQQPALDKRSRSTTIHGIAELTAPVTGWVMREKTPKLAIIAESAETPGACQQPFSTASATPDQNNADIINDPDPTHAAVLIPVEAQA